MQEIKKIGIFIGGMRCGSTAFRDYMLQHPEICVHKTKDPHFFSSDENWNKGLEWYMSGWSDFNPDKHKIAVESSTHYTKYPLYPSTAKRMGSLPIDMRLIYGVRGPIERVESHLVHNAGKGYLDPDNPDERKKLIKQAINVSNYDLQISKYEPFFPSEQIFIMPLNELKQNPNEVLARIFGFFNVDPDYAIDTISIRPRKFKNDIKAIKLTENECAWITEELREPVQRFEERYHVQVWDEDN